MKGNAADVLELAQVFAGTHGWCGLFLIMVKYWQMNQLADEIPLASQQAMTRQQPGSSRMALEDQALAAYHVTGNKQDYFDVFKKYYDVNRKQQDNIKYR